jgi:hypothetical protein
MFENFEDIYQSALNGGEVSNIAEREAFTPEEEKIVFNVYSKNRPEDIIDYLSSLDSVHSFEDAEKVLVCVLTYTNGRLSAIQKDHSCANPYEVEMYTFGLGKINEALKFLATYSLLETVGGMLNGEDK